MRIQAASLAPRYVRAPRAGSELARPRTRQDSCAARPRWAHRRRPLRPSLRSGRPPSLRHASAARAPLARHQRAAHIHTRLRPDTTSADATDDGQRRTRTHTHTHGRTHAHTHRHPYDLATTPLERVGTLYAARDALAPHDHVTSTPHRPAHTHHSQGTPSTAALLTRPHGPSAVAVAAAATSASAAAPWGMPW